MGMSIQIDDYATIVALLYIHVYVYVCIMCIFICVCLRSKLLHYDQPVYTYEYVCTYLHSYMFTCTRVPYIHMCIYISCTYSHEYIYIHIHIHIHIHVHMHPCTHAYHTNMSCICPCTHILICVRLPDQTTMRLLACGEVQNQAKSKKLFENFPKFITLIRLLAILNSRCVCLCVGLWCGRGGGQECVSD